MGGGTKPDTPPLADAASPPAPARCPRRVLTLLGVLILHGFGALTWFAFLGFSSDAGTDRQFNQALTFGAATWLVAAVLMAWLWWSGRSSLSLSIPFAWWLPSFLLMIAVVYGWNTPVEGPTAAVNATATFDESAGCLGYWHDFHGWRLNNDNVSDCFPRQTAVKKKVLIACFNKYEQNHSDHDDWPEDNMRGCTWDGLTTAPVRNVARLVFGKVVAVPAAPRAGKRFALAVGVTRSDSAAKDVHTALEDGLFPDVAVTVDGENVAIETVGAPCASCAVGCTCPGITEPEAWFFDGKIRVKFMVPKTAAGKRLAIRMTAEQGDAPTATKVVTFTVGA